MTEPRSLRELGAFVHVFHRGGSDIEVVALHLAARGLRAIDGLHAVEEAVTPVHEGLGVDVLVILGEVEAALQGFVNDTTVVLARQAKFRFDRGSEERASEFVEPLAFDHDAGRGPIESLHVRDREAHVLEPQRLERLEAEDIADDRGAQVRDRPGLEEVEIVSDVGEVLTGRARNRFDLVGLGAVTVAGREPIRPHHRPGRSRGFTRNRSGGLFGIDALLGRDAEEGEDVRVLRAIIAVPVAHFGVLEHAGLVALGRGSRCGRLSIRFMLVVPFPVNEADRAALTLLGPVRNSSPCIKNSL